MVPTPSLTAREREVLKCIADGQHTKQIAMNLCVSAKTVETHRMHLMEKLNRYNVAELTKYAIREGVTTLDDVPPDPPARREPVPLVYFREAPPQLVAA
jgi:DNA-binding CsgD family transcriptional regulator